MTILSEVSLSHSGVKCPKLLKCCSISGILSVVRADPSWYSRIGVLHAILCLCAYTVKPLIVIILEMGTPPKHNVQVPFVSFPLSKDLWDANTPLSEQFCPVSNVFIYSRFPRFHCTSLNLLFRLLLFHISTTRFSFPYSGFCAGRWYDHSNSGWRRHWRNHPYICIGGAGLTMSVSRVVFKEVISCSTFRLSSNIRLMITAGW